MKNLKGIYGIDSTSFLCNDRPINGIHQVFTFRLLSKKNSDTYLRLRHRGHHGGGRLGVASSGANVHKNDGGEGHTQDRYS